MSTPVRRNDPCPCGSGLRYKECHGKLGASSAPPTPEAQIPRALQLHQAGRVDEAERIYREVLAAIPGHAIASHYLGMAAWHRGDPVEGERLMRASIAADASIADFHNNLGLLLRDTGRAAEALDCFARTLATDPAWIEAHSNRGLALESLGRFDEAVAEYRRALAAAPQFAVVHQNLARVLLTLGDFREGWEHYRWRLAAQGLARTAPPAAATPLPANLVGRRFALITEQGIGDVLFFLRFAPELVRRGARLAFHGDMRLAPLLARTGLFELAVLPEHASTADAERIHIGDLPWLLEAHDASALPPPLPLTADAPRVSRWRETLAAWGPPPHVALTWRAGLAARGPAQVQLKAVVPAVLADAVRDSHATFVSVQRLPGDGEREALEQALGAPVHDASAANDDLDEILALLAVVGDYVGVSNANTHLRAGLGKPMHVLVPFPPEWRWMRPGERSPWFPGVRITRL